MRVLVVYESMYGNTRAVAERIGEGLDAVADGVDIVAVGELTDALLHAADLLVVGAPTHHHGLSTHRSRDKAIAEETLAHEAEVGHDVEVDPDAEGPGLREWFDGLDLGHPLPAAAFDTRPDALPLLTGRASRGIRRRLQHHGFRMIAEPESFVVGDDLHLVDGEAERAVDWGRGLLGHVAQHSPKGRPSEDTAHDVLGGVIESGGRFASPT